MNISQKIDLISRADIGYIRCNEPLKAHSSWRIGGPADLYVEPVSDEQISRVVKITTEFEIPLVVIGDGTNLLFDDLGVRGVVLKLGKHFDHYSIQGARVSAKSGLWVPRLARATAIAGLSGLEHTIGIPGTIGGLVCMNGGSLRKSIGDNIISITIIDSEGVRKRLTKEECGFEYRNSIFQKSNMIVVDVDLELLKAEKHEIKTAMLEILRSRRIKFPLKQPNCGSVFECSSEIYNCIGPPGKIIEELDLKGFSVGGARISDVHANFFINSNNASSKDMLNLIASVRNRVFDRFKTWMKCEVRYVSIYGKISPIHDVI